MEENTKLESPAIEQSGSSACSGAALEDDAELVRRMTAAMREADAVFERVGGSTRHHVRDCLLPTLGKHGLSLIKK